MDGQSSLRTQGPSEVTLTYPETHMQPCLHGHGIGKGLSHVGPQNAPH